MAVEPSSASTKSQAVQAIVCVSRAAFQQEGGIEYYQRHVQESLVTSTPMRIWQIDTLRGQTCIMATLDDSNDPQPTLNWKFIATPHHD